MQAANGSLTDNLQNDGAGFKTSANYWHAGAGDEDHSSSSSILRRTDAGAGNLDRNLFNDLVEIVPLVQSLIDRKSKTSFTRRGSMIYTKTPARDYLSKKTEVKVRNAVQSIPTKKRMDPGDKDQGYHGGDNQEGCGDSFSLPSSSSLTEDKEELIALRDQVEDLNRKLSEKDELLKSTENLKSQMSSTLAKLDELEHQVLTKDSIVKSSQLQLSDAKIKLADKQAALERLEWEAMNSNTLVEKLQENVNIMQAEMSSFMLLCEGLRRDDTLSTEDEDATVFDSNNVPDIDPFDEIEMQKMEAAQEAYIAAVAAAKENPDEESIGVARSARLHLLSLVLKKKN